MTFFIIYRQPIYNFNDITHNQKNKIVIIKSSNDEQISNKWLKSLEKSSFIKYHGKLGNTTRLEYDMYDENYNKLFTLIDVGNNNLIIIKYKNKETVYQQLEG